MTTAQDYADAAGMNPAGGWPGTPRPVPVEVTNPEVLAGAVRSRRKYVRSVYRTFALTAANPIWPIAAEDLSRDEIWLVAYGNSVVICESQSQAQDPANLIAGTGMFANTPANPQGTLLYVPPAGAVIPQVQTADATASVTSPGALGVITSLALAAGTWQVGWSVQLGGTQLPADTQNMGLYTGTVQDAIALFTGVGQVAPAFPATGVSIQNPNPFPVTAVIAANGATITAIVVNGITVGVAAGTYIIPAAGSFSASYTVATPTWTWANATAPAPIYPQQTQTLVLATAATVAVKAIGAATTGAVYGATLAATPAASVSATVPVSEQWTLRSTEPVWATALAFPTLLAVTLVNCADNY